MLISSVGSWEIWGAQRLSKVLRVTPWVKRSDFQPQQAGAQLWVLRIRMSQKMSYRFQSTAHHSSQAVSKLTCEATVTNLHSTEKKTSSQRGGSDHGKGNRDLTWELDLLLLWSLLLVFQISRLPETKIVSPGLCISPWINCTSWKNLRSLFHLCP